MKVIRKWRKWSHKSSSSWYELENGEVINGQKNLMKRLKELQDERNKTPPVKG